MRAFAPLPKEVYETMTGLEVLQAMVRGDLPGAPIAKTLNFSLVEADHGRAVFAGEPTEDFLNPHGSVHGGWAATLLDSALGCAVHTTLTPGEKYTTVEMKVNYLRPVFPGKPGRLICEGKVINRGRTLALSEAKLVDLEGRLYAHASETCMIFPKA